MGYVPAFTVSNVLCIYVVGILLTNTVVTAEKGYCVLTWGGSDGMAVWPIDETRLNMQKVNISRALVIVFFEYVIYGLCFLNMFKNVEKKMQSVGLLDTGGHSGPKTEIVLRHTRAWHRTTNPRNVLEILKVSVTIVIVLGTSVPVNDLTYHFVCNCEDVHYRTDGCPCCHW